MSGYILARLYVEIANGPVLEGRHISMSDYDAFRRASGSGGKQDMRRVAGSGVRIDFGAGARHDVGGGEGDVAGKGKAGVHPSDPRMSVQAGFENFAQGIGGGLR